TKKQLKQWKKEEKNENKHHREIKKKMNKDYKDRLKDEREEEKEMERYNKVMRSPATNKDITKLNKAKEILDKLKKKTDKTDITTKRGGKLWKKYLRAEEVVKNLKEKLKKAGKLQPQHKLKKPLSKDEKRNLIKFIKLQKKVFDNSLMSGETQYNWSDA